MSNWNTGQSYAGGSWHVEGQVDEHIVATGLYCYDSHTITESWIAFKQGGAAKECHEKFDFDYEHSEHHFLLAVYGLQNLESTAQDIGG